MRRLGLAGVLVVACGSPSVRVGADGRPGDAPRADSHTGLDAAALSDGGDGSAGSDGSGSDGSAAVACAPFGAPGTCIETSACAAIGDHTSFPGYCPGPADIQCCIQTPSVEDNPPTPTGYELMEQAEVTPAMTTWAVMILDDPTTYPMFSTTTMLFGTLDVLARVEWHPPDFQNSVVHRGVTLYQPD